MQELNKLRRRHYHPLQHEIHHTHKISRKTLFYIKEYGAQSHTVKTIMKESIGILLLASFISLSGGLALEQIKPILLSIIPLIVLLPALNGMIGSFGTVISSRFSTMLFEGKVKKDWQKNKELNKLLIQIIIISIIMALISGIISLLFSWVFQNYPYSFSNTLKIMFIPIIDTIILVIILFLVSIYAGLYYFKKNEDPNNFLIPITTSIADFGNMIILAFLIIWLF